MQLAEVMVPVASLQMERAQARPATGEHVWFSLQSLQAGARGQDNENRVSGRPNGSAEDRMNAA